jgi:hypothetical protein
LAMRAVRRVRSDALFLHTEDGGRTWATEALAEHGATREQRRWLGTDLLCGRVSERHELFGFMRENGLSSEEILWFADNPCPPDVIGLNYYITSDRFLDHRTEGYPESLVGGDSGSEPLVDIEAVRLRRGGISGAGAILRDAWDRYGLPVAITEAHMGGDIEDQLAWLTGIWKEAAEARESGVECVAVTVWALLGSYDWCTLVTRDEGIYERGVFDVSGGLGDRQPVPTRLVDLVKRMAAGQSLPPARGGWWKRPDRFTFDPIDEGPPFSRVE